MGLNPGDLDREIVFQVATVTKNPHTGATITTWNDEEDVTWAEWVPGGTRETWKDPRLASTIDGVFRIYDRTNRPQPDTYRVRFEGRIFDVKPCIEIDRGVGLIVPVVARGESL